ncbi:hypothetical protein QC762_600160 [Podospora pseudocomata]|uniref:Zn(2)-C6 fungal-type domain-containing protein n=1 Tax=Podospora pseudocomata TaxID=2093779 RepID=A0ABR0G7V8_9PEZI|nr:hypothetical protein QC762_600160 [Podospora pseudocomata]
MEEWQVQPQTMNPTGPLGRGSRGKLDLAKCDHCRKDRKKCTPQPRQWPQRCDRCEDKGFKCSPSTQARKRRREKPRGLLLSASFLPQDRPSTHPCDDWTHADLSDAISFLKILYRVRTKISLWEKDLGTIYVREDIETLCNIGCEFVTVIETLHENLLEHIASKIAGLSTGQNDSENTALEASRLHLAACSILQAKNTEWNEKDYESLSVTESTLINSMIKSNLLNDEIGAVLILEDELLAKRAHSRKDSLHTVETLASRFEMFRPVMEKLWNWCTVPSKATNLLYGGMSVIERFRNASVIDVNATWVRTLVMEKATWSLQDCLGSPILHGILRGLGRGLWIPSREEEKYLYSNIGPYCDQHNPADILGRSAIHIAVQYNVPGAVTALLESNINPDQEADNGKLALHLAAASGHLEACKVLLNHTENVWRPDHLEKTAIDYALCNGNRDIVRLLLESGIGDYDVASISWMVLIAAMEQCKTFGVCTEVLNWYEMAFSPASLDTFQDSNGATVLHLAVVMGNLEVVQELAKRSAKWRRGSINLQDEEGQTALCLAVCQKAEKDWLAIIRTLLGIDGIDIDVRDHKGKAPMDYAKEGELSLVVRMLENKQNASTRGEATNTSKHCLQTTHSVPEGVALPIPSQQPLHLLPPPASEPGYWSQGYSPHFSQDNNINQPF